MIHDREAAGLKTLVWQSAPPPCTIAQREHGATAATTDWKQTVTMPVAQYAGLVFRRFDRLSAARR